MTSVSVQVPRHEHPHTAIIPDTMRALSTLLTNTLVTLPRRAILGSAISAMALGGTGNAASAEDQLPKTGGYVQFCNEDTMSQKAHGTSEKPVQKDLRWQVDGSTADRICNFNRHYAEYAGYWATTSFLKEVDRTGPTVYYDSVTGKPLFVAPIGRTMEAFLAESKTHGWPSFRDEEVVWENMRVLKSSGEAVSADGTHLGHNLPDGSGNRYCINLVSVAGRPLGKDEV